MARYIQRDSKGRVWHLSDGDKGAYVQYNSKGEVYHTSGDKELAKEAHKLELEERVIRARDELAKNTKK